MQLEQNEHTISSFIEYLGKKFGTKITGKPFNSSDVAQYTIRGYCPYRYGGNKLTTKFVSGVKIITIGDSEVKVKKHK